MERYENLFAQLKDRKEGAFVPFVTLGDPSVEQSLKIIDTLIEAGADALELGIPFSDPLADGPTIQEATLRCTNPEDESLLFRFNLYKEVPGEKKDEDDEDE